MNKINPVKCKILILLIITLKNMEKIFYMRGVTTFNGDFNMF